MKYIVIISILYCFLISCGAPDPSEIAVDLNQPYITRIVPGDQELTIYFESQNDEISFSGYNISFGAGQDRYRDVRIANNLNLFPSMTAKRSPEIYEYYFTIKDGLSYISNGITNSYNLDIANGIPLYVLVTAYQISYERESSYGYSNFVMMGCPRPEHTTVISSGSAIQESPQSGITITLATFNATTMTFSPNAGGGIQVRSGSSLQDINIPPVNGYSTDPIPVASGQLYLTSSSVSGNTYYGKIFVRSINTTAGTATIDYCFQTAENILSY